MFHRRKPSLCISLLPLRAMRPAHLIDLITTITRTNHEAPHYAIVTSFPLSVAITRGTAVAGRLLHQVSAAMLADSHEYHIHA